jgi:aquaporin Z
MSPAKYLVEFIGTYFLVFAIGMASGDLAPIAIGSMLMVMIYAGGHVSGAHYNPAVTLAVTMRGKCKVSDVAPYVIAQVVAAVAAALTVKFFKGDAAVTPLELDVAKALVAEFLLTFALVFVILNVATAKATSGNSYYGLAIAFTVVAGAFAVGSISGGVFNPAVALALIVLGVSSWADIWIYLVANFAAAAVAAIAFRYINPDDK